MPKKIRIGFLTHTMMHGGASISLLLLQKSLESKGEFYRVTIVGNNPHSEIYKEYQKHNDIIEQIDLQYIQNNQVTQINLFKFFYYKWKSKKHVIETINKYDFDILHINTSILPHLLKPIKKHTSVKIVTHVRELIKDDLFNIKKRYIIDQINTYSDAIIAISENESDYFQRHSNLHVLPNPFDFKKSTISRIHPKTQQVKIAMMATLSPAKGNLEFLQSLQLVANKYNPNSKFKFYMIGANTNYNSPFWKTFIKKLLFRKSYYEKLKKFINLHNLHDFIEIIPYTSDIFSILSNIDILVRPAITEDPWGRDIIEAMAMKIPVIAFGDSEVYIKNNVTGYLISNRSIEQLSEKITALIDDPVKRKTFGINAYKVVSKMCDIDEYGKRINRIYHEILK